MKVSEKELRSGLTTYPKRSDTFRAFSFFPPEDLKVVILGQDPYHNPDSATGLAFQDGAIGKAVRPSLRNIEGKLGKPMNFEETASKGVLWLNTALTVSEGIPNSHADIWKPFTEELIKSLNSIDGVVWVLWGGNALSYEKFITNDTHKKIISSHPSPLSNTKKLKGYLSFNDSDPFNTVNTYINQNIF